MHACGRIEACAAEDELRRAALVLETLRAEEPEGGSDAVVRLLLETAGRKHEEACDVLRRTGSLLRARGRAADVVAIVAASGRLQFIVRAVGEAVAAAETAVRARKGMVAGARATAQFNAAAGMLQAARQQLSAARARHSEVAASLRAAASARRTSEFAGAPAPVNGSVAPACAGRACVRACVSRLGTL